MTPTSSPAPLLAAKISPNTSKLANCLLWVMDLTGFDTRDLNAPRRSRLDELLP